MSLSFIQLDTDTEKGKGAKDAVKHLSKELNFGKYGYIVELGCKIDSEYKKQLERTVENKIKKNKEKKAKEESESLSDLDSDDTFSFIAGYTSGGAAYGTSWEELDDYDDDADYELPF